MATSKKVSIVLPTFNGQKHIRQAIENCLHQTYENLELVIVNDGSSDKTEEIIKSFGSLKIKYLKNERNIGLAESLNIGFKNTTGEYLTWVSDDNYYSPDAIGTMANVLDEDQEVSFVYSNFFQIDESGNIKKRLKTLGPRYLEMKNCVGPSFLYKREVYEQTGDYNPEFFLAEDYEYWLRVSKKFKLKKINNFLCYYRLHPESLRSKNLAYKIEEQAKRAADFHAGLIGQAHHNLRFFLAKYGYKLSKMVLNRQNNAAKINCGEKKAYLTLSFDCDYAEDVLSLPKLLNELSAYSIRASFACVGRLIEKYPKEHLMILDYGHEIINHTYSHPDNGFNKLSQQRKTEEIEKCHQVCEDILNYSPSGFRTPHFGNQHSEDVYDVLPVFGYEYSSSTVATETPFSGTPFLKKGVIEIPLTCCPKHPFAVFDTWHCLKRGRAKHTGKKFYDLFKELIDFAIKNNSYINVYFDPQDVASLQEFKLMLDYINKFKKDIRVIDYKELCNMIKLKTK